MPRNNRKRKNQNCRKPKPIKFSQSDVASEQKAVESEVTLANEAENIQENGHDEKLNEIVAESDLNDTEINISGTANKSDDNSNSDDNDNSCHGTDLSNEGQLQASAPILETTNLENESVQNIEPASDACDLTNEIHTENTRDNQESPEIIPNKEDVEQIEVNYINSEKNEVINKPESKVEAIDITQALNNADDDNNNHLNSQVENVKNVENAINIETTTIALEKHENVSNENESEADEKLKQTKLNEALLKPEVVNTKTLKKSHSFDETYNKKIASAIGSNENDRSLNQNFQANRPLEMSLQEKCQQRGFLVNTLNIDFPSQTPPFIDILKTTKCDTLDVINEENGEVGNSEPKTVTENVESKTDAKDETKLEVKKVDTTESTKESFGSAFKPITKNSEDAKDSSPNIFGSLSTKPLFSSNVSENKTDFPTKRIDIVQSNKEPKYQTFKPIDDNEDSLLYMLHSIAESSEYHETNDSTEFYEKATNMKGNADEPYCSFYKKYANQRKPEKNSSVQRLTTNENKPNSDIYGLSNVNGSNRNAYSDFTYKNTMNPIDFDRNVYPEFSIDEFKSLRHLCVEKLFSMPYGNTILEELANVAESLGNLTDKHNFEKQQQQNKQLDTDTYSQYSNPNVPAYESRNWDMNTEPTPPPPPPLPRTHKSNIKQYITNTSKSPTPPPVPNRTWLDIPKTAGEPSVMRCISPSLRDLMNSHTDYNSNQFLDIQNNFIDRYGHSEHTDNEVTSINFKKHASTVGAAASGADAATVAPTESEHETNTKDSDNNLLALIREINQLTNVNENNSATTTKTAAATSSSTAAGSNEVKQINKNKISDSNKSEQIETSVDEKMLSFPVGKEFLSDKRHSINDTYDFLRDRPTSEKMDKTKRYSSFETSCYESKKCIENGNVTFNFANSSNKKSSDGNNDNAIDSLKNTFQRFKEQEQREQPNKVKTETNIEVKCEQDKKDAGEKCDETKETKTNQNESGRFSFKEFDYIPKFFSDFFRYGKESNDSKDNSTKIEANQEVQQQPNVSESKIDDKPGKNSNNSSSISSQPMPNELYKSTQSLLELLDNTSNYSNDSRILPSNTLNVRKEGGFRCGRISPNVIRAPRISESPEKKETVTKTGTSSGTSRHYDWNTTKQNRAYENRQSMIDQTPITQHLRNDSRRMSMPRVIHDRQLESIMEKEKELSDEYEKLERDRLRLLKEIEEMKVNQNFEDFCKEHKLRNNQNVNMNSLSEAELFRKQMQDEWLSKVAEREERRLQKMIKLSNVSEELQIPKACQKGLSDEFLDRVKERRKKLHLPSDSDWESGAESQPVKREENPPQSPTNLKIFDGKSEAELKKLPKHLEEFAEFTTKVQSESHTESTIKSESKEIIHQIEQESSDKLTSLNSDDKQPVILGPRFKATAPKGVWTPGTSQPLRRDLRTQSLDQLQQLHNLQSVPPIPPSPSGNWKQPRSADPSPVSQRKEFRPVRFESPRLGRKLVYTQPYSQSLSSVNASSNENLVREPPRAPVEAPYTPYQKVPKTYYPPGGRRPNDSHYSHNEYITERQNIENERQRMANQIGPIEVTLRSEAENGDQHEWYKKMYKKIHKVHDDDDCLTVRYKTRRGPYKSSNGYSSEPERNDYGTVQNPVRPSGTGFHITNPGKIENYTPGNSALSSQQTIDKLRKQKHHIEPKSDGNLGRALKDQGYESDSTLVFRKKEASQIAPMSPDEQRKAYLNLQSGGEAPIQGFRKPAPEKRRDNAYNIEYTPITSTLTKIQVHRKNASTPIAYNTEIICYPIMNVTRPIDLFGSIPVQPQNFIPPIPPQPPNRRSSKQNSVLKICAEMQHQEKKSQVKHRIRSHSASSLSSSHRSLKEERRVHSPSRLIRTEPRKSSPSNIAFGRSISKERTFAEEKKKLEERLPPCKKTIRATTSILRDPQVKSNKQVKKAVRSTYIDPPSGDKLTFSLSSGKTRELRTLNISSDKTSKKFLKDNEESVDFVSVEVSNRNGKSNRVERATNSNTKIDSKPNQILKTSSNLSLEHTSSTYSIDSTKSKSQKSTHLKTASFETAKVTKPITITSKPQKKKIEKSLSIAKHQSRSAGSRQSSAIHASTKSTESESSYATSGNFFQKLLVHNRTSVSPDRSQNAVVQERLHLWNTFPRRSAIKKTPPSSIYLTQKQPVRSSKFKNLERETLRQSRSLSPSKPKTIFYDYSSKFDSHYQLTDDEEEFGYDYSCAHDASIKSEREPIITLERPKIIQHPIFVPQEIRSPSCRRIQSFRTNKRHEEIVNGSSRRYHSLDSHLRARSSLSVKSENSKEDEEICLKSNKFKDLNKFYSKVERVGELERATSNTNLHPIRKDEELIDFDVWKKVRCYERAKKELNELLGKLKHDEKEKEFLFRPKYVEDIKWDINRDRGLRAREKSVEDLKEIFAEKVLENELNNLRRKPSLYDTYKPLWRANSVLDLASSMVVKHSPQSPFIKRARSLKEITFLSKNLLSTLSKDQIKKIKSQLTEIYSNNRSLASGIPDEYIINVTKKYDKQPSSLFVRRNSSLSEEDLSKSLHIEHSKDGKKVSTISHEARISRSADRYDSVIKRDRKIYTEEEKRQLLQQLGNEIKDKIRERREKILQPRETRGAIAAENPITRKAPEQPSTSYLLNYKEKTRVHQTGSDTEKNRSVDPTAGQDTILSESSTEVCEQEINVSKGDLNEKIEYFENKKDEEFEKTIYHAREDSSPDEEEIMKVINEKMRARAEVEKRSSQIKLSSSGLSTSACDLKEIFGEKDASRNLIDFSEQQNGNSSLKNASSIESLYRSRSISPIHNSAHSTLRRGNKDDTDTAVSRQFQSDPDLSQVERNVDPFRLGTGSNTGDVSRITHKFETHNVTASRGRSRYRKSISPIQKISIKKDDRYMPHIDIISKTASLKRQIERKLPKHHSEHPLSGEVDKIKSKFEALTSDNVSLIGKMFTSTPNIAELNNITEYLTGSWIAHKYPRPNDNARSSQSPERAVPDNEIIKKKSASRSSSSSPPRSQSVSTILKQFYDIFSEQDYYDLKNLPTLEGPVGKELQAEFLWRRLKRTNGFSSKPSVQFKERGELPSPPPLPEKDDSLNNILLGSENLDSPRRYVEGDVNIHYKTPIRYEYKDPLSNAELAQRQDQMKTLYQEERRKKYLQELQDLSNRRHTDNFTPSQKSPIPLNRYDEFNGPNSAPKSPSSRSVARGLYNFQGQTARELSFKKGDLILVRRKVDENWLEGELNGGIGLIPANYVEVISKDGWRPVTKKPSEGQARAKFNFQAQSAIELSLNKGELVTLTRRVDDNWFEGKIANRKGIFPVSYVDVLTDIGSENSTVIPTKPIGSPAAHSLITTPDYLTPSHSDYVSTTSVTSNGYPSPIKNDIVRETKTIHKTEILHVDTNSEPVPYKAIYKYRPQNTDELELQEGDTVYVLEKCDDGWFVGTSQRTGCFGTFPGNYVKPL